MASRPADPDPDDPSTPRTQIAVDQYTADGASYTSELDWYTASLVSKVTDYRSENGRRYHAFREGSYVFPNDAQEMDRLDIMHKMIVVALDTKLYLAPIKDPRKILDLATGTGIWAIEIGDQFPNARVLGNDLSPIQPRWVPSNVHFEVDDIEADWAHSIKFDFIFSRCLYCSIKDWPRLVKQVYDNLEPGGIAEFVDMDAEWRSPDGSHKGTVGEKTNNTFIEVMQTMGLDPSPGTSLEKWLKHQGFEQVQVTTRVLPFGTWPVEKQLKEVGAYNYMQMQEGWESFLLGPFTRMLNQTKEQVENTCRELRALFMDPSFHAYYVLYDVHGRKPNA